MDALERFRNEVVRDLRKRAQGHRNGEQSLKSSLAFNRHGADTSAGCHRSIATHDLRARQLEGLAQLWQEHGLPARYTSYIDIVEGDYHCENCGAIGADCACVLDTGPAD